MSACGQYIGVWLGAPDQEEDLIALNAEDLFTPASNTKLFTVAAAQARLLGSATADRAAATLQTSFWLAHAPQAGGAAKLTILGGGDPTLTFAELREAAAAMSTRLGELGTAVDIEVDASVFGRAAVPDAWDWGYVSTTSGVLPSGVVVDRNTMLLTVSPLPSGALTLAWEHPAADEAVEVDSSAVEVRPQGAPMDGDQLEINWRLDNRGRVLLGLTGSVRSGVPAVLQVPCLRPDHRAGQLLTEALELAGVQTTGRVTVVDGTGRRNAAVPGAVELHVIRSPPLLKILRECMHPSDNLYAECLLRLLSTPEPHGGVSGCLSELATAIGEAGVDTRRLRLLDGSGMCSKNWICPRACVELLQAKASCHEFYTFLPVAAESGTIAARFHGSRAAGQLRAKTGTLGGTAALSGYYKGICFSIMINNVVHAGAHSEIVAAVDAIALELCAAADSDERARL